MIAHVDLFFLVTGHCVLGYVLFFFFYSLSSVFAAVAVDTASCFFAVLTFCLLSFFFLCFRNAVTCRLALDSRLFSTDHFSDLTANCAGAFPPLAGYHLMLGCGDGRRCTPNNVGSF